MDGEFRVRLRNYEPDVIVGAFIDRFGNNLAQEYANSRYQVRGVFTIEDFCAGYVAADCIFLVYNREGNFLKVYVEPANKKDLKMMKDLLNRYFSEITLMLEDEKIAWNKPQASITLEECPVSGTYKSKLDNFKELIEDQRETLFYLPIGTVAAAILAIYLNIASREDAGKDLRKAVISTLEAVIVFLLLVLSRVLLSKSKRAFTFKI